MLTSASSAAQTDDINIHESQTVKQSLASGHTLMIRHVSCIVPHSCSIKKCNLIPIFVYLDCHSAILEPFSKIVFTPHKASVALLAGDESLKLCLSV